MNTNNWVEPQIGECIAKSEQKYFYNKKPRVIISMSVVFISFVSTGFFLYVAFDQGFEKSWVNIIGIGSLLVCIGSYFDLQSTSFTWDLYYIDEGVFIIKEDAYKGQELCSNQVGLKDGKLIYKGISFILSDRFKNDPLSLLNFINNQL